MQIIITHMHDGAVSVEHHDCPLSEPKEPIEGKFGTTYFFNDRTEASQWLNEIYLVEQRKLKKGTSCGTRNLWEYSMTELSRSAKRKLQEVWRI